MARIDQVLSHPISGAVPATFTIIPSQPGDMRTSITPDAGLCLNCREELFDPINRRYRYGFTNCTNCGPRFSIIEAAPYDRCNTSMRRFPLCDTCEIEYQSTGDRRFHAQPTACAECGPSLWLEVSDNNNVYARDDSAISDAQARLKGGEILAVKGLGGFHLACNALDKNAITRLRKIKQRASKPFAVMCRDLDVAGKYCELSSSEADLLTSSAAPIVLLTLKPEQLLPTAIAPGLNRLGVMLPYTPLHTLLMECFDTPIVMTSGNRHSAPQVTDNTQARKLFSDEVDAFLMHDRDITNRVDDSLVQLIDGTPQVLRLARGYAPMATPLPRGFDANHPQLLAFGGDNKNAFAIAKAGTVVLSQHIGQLGTVESLSDFEKNVQLYLKLFEVLPAKLVSDSHPAYRSSQIAAAMADALDIPMDKVGHHHAHAAACMLEHRLESTHPPVLALIQDGIGAAVDGSLWGCEVLYCDYRQHQRLASVKPAALLGGDKAATEPWRNLLARLHETYGPHDAWPAMYQKRLQDKPLDVLIAAKEAGVNTPLCSSAGRLFDAVAAVVDICSERQSYEGEAAMKLQAAAEIWLANNLTPLPYSMNIVRASDQLLLVDPIPIWDNIAADVIAGAHSGEIAAKFHLGWATVWCRIVERLAANLPERPAIVLSGGAFQNRLLASMLSKDLQLAGFHVLQQSLTPAGDGGLALGQIAISLARSDREPDTQQE